MFKRTRTLTASEVAQCVIDANGRGDSLVSVLAVDGPGAGARVLVSADGTLVGTLGNAARDTAAVSLARQSFASHEPLRANGLFAELHTPRETLFIFGAGHIAVPLAELGVRLGFAVTVLDDREEFTNETRFPADVAVQALDYATPLRGLRFDNDTYVVLVTRAHKYDFDTLRELLSCERQPRYIGMIGSRRRVRAAFTALLDGAITHEQLQRVHAPVGLDIGAETPAEIAVSIAAEIIRVRRGGSSESMASEERVLERFFPEPGL